MLKEKDKMEIRILKAATEVFLEKGYAGTNMTLIAQAAGINRPALYYYFRTKDRIFNELFGLMVKSFIPRLLEILNSNDPMEVRLERFVDSYFEQLSKEPRLPIFILRENFRDPEFLLKTVFDLNLENYFSELRLTYEKEVSLGNLKEVPPFAILYTCLGQIVFPFLTKPFVQTVFVGNQEKPWVVASDFNSLMTMWKPYVVKSLKSLLFAR